ncbi:hypothetical protein PENSUB_6090 [Penicillium subrubescens]|uniref:Uncharacterized protein n=1 Tax=Penicillium subrubescens TaxID=1316194 RepID=A0A1Q5U4W1_9EURO|nr:hypothetical protein PENSUB_6090 [Penicillium subrubescens]
MQAPLREYCISPDEFVVANHVLDLVGEAEQRQAGWLWFGAALVGVTPITRISVRDVSHALQASWFL